MATDRDPRPENEKQDAAEQIAALAQRSQRVWQAFLERQVAGDSFQIPDPTIVGRTLTELWTKLLADPARLAELQLKYWQDATALWQAQARRLAGAEDGPRMEPAADDRRFKDEAWSEELIFDTIKQSYLLTAEWVRQTVSGVEGLDPQARRRAEFYTRQYLDALAPTNFALTNPKVLRATVESGGRNLLKGLENLLGDLENGRGQLQISMTDPSAFRIGENIATTPGKVVYQNELMQLIQYEASTETVHKRPLLIVPPWINKFYILDLREKNSLIKWIVDQGFTLFVISWINPGAELAHKSFDDYLLEGPMAALDAIAQATGEREVNIVGYCIGGTLTACTLAYLAARGDGRVKSATFLTTMLDFEDPGELGVFIDDEQLALLEQHMEDKGYLEGRHMARVFNLMRDNDLIWSFVINNYLLGKEPMPFDLLYWNADSTRMPNMMHRFYLRNMYQKNRLAQPGGISLAGVPIDLGQIRIPSFFLSTKDDHIAPWTATYRGARLLGGRVTFVLAGSGHIAGVINPPTNRKYGYWTNPKLPHDPEAWLADAKPGEGSWWPRWAKWLGTLGGRQVPARAAGSGTLPALEGAPGSYVKARAED